MTIYIDFDNTIVSSNQRVIDILNTKYNINKSEEDLSDYDFQSIAPISIKDKNNIFESDEFFLGLDFKSGFLKFFDKYKDKVNFIVITKGSEENLRKKEVWLKSHLDKEIKILGVTNDSLSKNVVDMRGCIQIDDCTNALDTNAEIKILYKSGNNFPWQNLYEGNCGILITNNWSEIDEIVEFYMQYDYKTLTKKGN